MLAMNGICNLLFELSNPDRLRILFSLQEQAMRLTHLAEKLDLSVQETSRHLSRLNEAKLIVKQVDGCYQLTPFGDHAMCLLPGFDFLSKHRDYLTNHTISHLPSEFVTRIGDLQNCTFTDDVMLVFYHIENMIQEAQEYIWLLASQILMSTLPFLEDAIKRGVKYRLILPEDLIPPPGFKPFPTVPQLMERKTLKHIDVGLFVSEKDARVIFPKIEDKADHTGFRSTDKRSHKWCKDLYLYYWERAKHGVPKGFPPLP